MDTLSDSGNVRRWVIAAAIVAGCLLVAGGIGHRMLTRHLDLAVGGEPIPAGTLNGLPLELGGWQGRKVPLDEEVIRQTDTDDHVNRAYVRGTSDAVGLFVGAGIRARDLSPHRPEVCYTGVGYTLVGARDATVKLADGTDLPCRLFRFSKGSLSAGTVTVLNYFIIDGQYCPDVELLRSKSWRGSKGIRYVARVMITASSAQSMSGDQAERAVMDFGAASARKILALLPQVKQDPTTEPGNGTGL